MENQHQKIKGYRELSQAEIDLMNEIKAHGQATEALLAKVHVHVGNQAREALNSGNKDEEHRIDDAQPQRWIAMARTDFQTGLMKLVRSVAQPTTF